MDSCFDIYKLGKVSLVVSSKIAQFLNCTYYNKSNDAHTHARTYVDLLLLLIEPGIESALDICLSTTVTIGVRALERLMW